MRSLNSFIFVIIVVLISIIIIITTKSTTATLSVTPDINIEFNSTQESIKCDNNDIRESCANGEKTSSTTESSSSKTTTKKPTTTTEKSSGLITKTTNAIYKALSSVFSHNDDDDDAGRDNNEGDVDDEDEEENLKIEATTQVYNSTRRKTTSMPLINTTLPIKTITTTTTIAPKKETTKFPKISPTTIRITSPNKTIVLIENKQPANSTILITTIKPPVAFNSTTTKIPNFNLTITTQPEVNSTNKAIFTNLITTKPFIFTSTTTTTPIISLPSFVITKEPELSNTTIITKTTTINQLDLDNKNATLISNNNETNFSLIDLNQTQTDQNNNSYLSNELYSIINNALKSIYYLRESSFLNRSTRVAPKNNNDDENIDHENIKRENFSNTNKSAKLQLSDLLIEDEKLANNNNKSNNNGEELHLLCKFLHKHLDDVNNSTSLLNLAINNLISSKATTTTTTTTESSTTTTTNSIDSSEFVTTEKNKYSSEQTIKDKNIFIVSNLNELNETYENKLIESILSFDSNQEGDINNYLNNNSIERKAQQLMLNLYNLAAKFKKEKLSQNNDNNLKSTTTDTVNSRSLDDENDDNNNNNNDSLSIDNKSKIINLFTIPENPFKIKIWRKATEKFNNHLHLVYWLLEQRYINNTNKKRERSSSFIIKYRIVEPKEASELLYQYLNYLDLNKQLEQVNLTPIGSLGSAYNGYNNNNNSKTFRDKDHKHNSLDQPEVIDDSLTNENVNVNANDGDKNKDKQFSTTTTQPSAFQLLLDNFSSPKFHDNLQLYTIIFLIIFFIIILMITIPIILYRRSQDRREIIGNNNNNNNNNNKRRRNGAENRRNKRRQQQNISTITGQSNFEENEANYYQQQHDNNVNKNQFFGENNSIWRKLSNTTTTLVRNESDLLRDNGGVNLPIRNEAEVAAAAAARNNNRENKQTHSFANTNPIEESNKFQWYSFEDRLEEQEEFRKVDNDNKREYIISQDKRKITKSIQKFPKGKREEQFEEQTIKNKNKELLMEYKNSLETNRSNTLTKSELVLLKEKLIPVGISSQKQQQQQSQQKQVASQTGESLDYPDYVNQLLWKNNHHERAIDVDTSGVSYIDKNKSLSTSDSSGENSTSTKTKETVIEVKNAIGEKQQTNLSKDYERRPKMRHVNLEPKAKSKVEEIKAELTKLEQRDRQLSSFNSAPNETILPFSSTSTYKRYDIV